MHDRILIGFGVVITLLLIRLDFKTDDLTNRVDQIEDAIIHTKTYTKYNKHDVECLAKNIYYEAGVEADTGKYAIGHVTLNRVRSGYWGDTVCKVVYSKAQFSWTLKKRLPNPDPTLFARCREIALAVLHGDRVTGLNKSLFYHADYIPNPNWVDVNHRVKKIGQHIFYNRAKGSTLEI